MYPSRVRVFHCANGEYEFEPSTDLHLSRTNIVSRGFSVINCIFSALKMYCRVRYFHCFAVIVVCAHLSNGVRRCSTHVTVHCESKIYFPKWGEYECARCCCKCQLLTAKSEWARARKWMKEEKRLCGARLFICCVFALSRNSADAIVARSSATGNRFSACEFP